MADIQEGTSSLVVRPELEDLRSKIQIKDSVSKTRKLLEAQIHEKKSNIESFKGQMKHLDGMIEIKSEELEVLERRLATLETLKD
jgi:flagellar motility protein MotE (MotC chaperone)